MTVLIAIILIFVIWWNFQEEIHKFLRVIAVIALVILLILFLPKVWPYILSGLQNALSAWPVLLMILACFGVYRYVRFKRSQEFIAWIDSIGIAKGDKVAVSQKILDIAEKGGSITKLCRGHILSTGFLKLVLNWLDQPIVVSEEILQDACQQFAPDFQSEYSKILLDFFSDADQLLLILNGDTTDVSDKLYVSSSLKESYIALFEEAGAATEDEYANLCEALDTSSAISLDPGAVAVTLLDYMVSKGITKKIELKDSGDTLFVSAITDGGTNLVRREISLDD